MFGSRTLVVALLASWVGCTRTNTPASSATVPTPTVAVGACGAPGRDGVMSLSPRLERADRDLDGDGQTEAVVVDRTACTTDGNCYWNIFRRPYPSEIDTMGCERYVGSLAGVALEPMATTGDGGMIDLRSYWKQSGNRVLLQEYRFVGGGYRLTDALSCRRLADQRIECGADDE